MPIRPTMGGFQAPQWLMETIRNLEQSIRRLEESINSLKRGETLSPTPRTQDVPTSTTTGGGGSGGAWNGGLGISINSQPATANAKLLNLKSGAGISLAKATDVTGLVDITVTNSSTQPIIKINGEVQNTNGAPFSSINLTSPGGTIEITNPGTTATDLGLGFDWVRYDWYPINKVTETRQMVDSNWAEVGELTVGLGGNYQAAEAFGWGQFVYQVLIENSGELTNRHIHVRVTSKTDGYSNNNKVFANFLWHSGHVEGDWSITDNTVSSSIDVDVTGIPAGLLAGPGAPAASPGEALPPNTWIDPAYLLLTITGTAQLHTRNTTNLKLWVKGTTNENIGIAAGSSVRLVPLVL